MHDGNDLPCVATGWALILLPLPGFRALQSHIEGLVGQSRALRVTASTFLTMLWCLCSLLQTSGASLGCLQSMWQKSLKLVPEKSLHPICRFPACPRSRIWWEQGVGSRGAGFYYSESHEALPFSEPDIPVLLHHAGSKCKCWGSARKDRWCELGQWKRLQKQRAISKRVWFG